MLNKEQGLTIGVFLLFFFLLYFGCDTKTKEIKDLEKSREQKFELISIDRIIGERFTDLPADIKNEVRILNQKLELVDSDTQKVNYLEGLASLWYKGGVPLVSGHYAESIADIKKDADSWAIAGTTYAIALKDAKDDNEKGHAVSKSRTSLENAISLEPNKVDHQLNLALTYVDNPLADNPMKGILMLVDLNKQNPDNIPVLMNLARLSMQTGQYEKGVERLTKVIELRPSLIQAHCMVAECYKQLGNGKQAEVHSLQCNK